MRSRKTSTESSTLKTCVGQGVLAAPHHVHAVADPVGIALRQLVDQRRRARALHVGLVDAAAHAALQARGADDVVELAAAQLDGAEQSLHW